MKLIFAAGFLALSWSNPATFSYKAYAKDLSALLIENIQELKSKDPSPIYYGIYRVHDSASWSMILDQGKVFSEDQRQSRTGEVELRLGNAHMDQSHVLADDENLSDAGLSPMRLPLDSKSPSHRRQWRMATEQAFRSAKERYQKVLRAVETQRKDTLELWDLAPAPTLTQIPELSTPKVDTLGQGRVRAELVQLSAEFAHNPRLQLSQLIFQHNRVHRLLVNSSGHQVLSPDSLSSLLLIMNIHHPDGSDISLVETRSFRDLPSSSEIQALRLDLQKAILRMDTIYNAPILEPYVGPVLLEGKAAAVFLHEILGHRVESDRFKLSNDGQTFLSKLNQSIFPDFISVSDQPLLRHWQNTPLNGYYLFDDEGIAPKGTQLVQNGVLQNFLSNRSPALKNGQSTGNGRAMLGRKPMARMSNLILSSSQTTPDSLLRQQLLSMAKEQGLPYALIIRDLSGGFTTTNRYMPQAFKLTPYYLVQVFVDGRPDRMVRGLDLAGTPLVSLGRIRKVGTESAVFNGFCGAESGWLPVSAVSPSLLFDKLEFQKQELQPSLPPFLPAPRAQ